MSNTFKTIAYVVATMFIPVAFLILVIVYG